MQRKRVRGSALLFVLVALSVLSTGTVLRGHADTPYSLNAVPAFAQEGTQISLVLTVKANLSATSQVYVFRFSVTDPAGTTYQSQLKNQTLAPGQDQFSIIVYYPSTSFPGSNSLDGQYTTWVDQLAPTLAPKVAASSFVLSITDSQSYERTQTLNIQGSGYNASESVGVTIRAQISSTLVFSQTVQATSLGIVSTSWKIPVNATIDNYVVTLTGTSTHKTPLDTQTISVRVAIMSIAGISTLKLSYQRTETMQFSFQPVYPDGTIASTGIGLLTLARPSGGNITLTATYDNIAQTFNASYRTDPSNQTGTWTVSLGAHGYRDAYGNISPGTVITNSLQLFPAALTVTVNTNTNIGVGQQLRFNATVTYPDGTSFQAGTVHAYLVYSGTPAINDTVPVVFDTGLGLWIGTYTAKSADTGGLWSLIVMASDSQAPPNSGSATRAISIQNNTPTPAGFPLYYFVIVAAAITGILVATFLVFKRRRVAHASLKIDLDVVHSEAGRIENQDFFKSVKEQLRKDKQD